MTGRKVDVEECLSIGLENPAPNRCFDSPARTSREVGAKVPEVLLCKNEFAADSPLEGDGFEPLVPLTEARDILVLVAKFKILSRSTR